MSKKRHQKKEKPLSLAAIDEIFSVFRKQYPKDPRLLVLGLVLLLLGIIFSFWTNNFTQGGWVVQVDIFLLGSGIALTFATWVGLGQGNEDE